MRKIRLLEVIFILVCTAPCLFAGPIDTLNKLSPEECIAYTLEKKDGKIITVALIDKDSCEIKVYGKGGELLETESNLHNVYEIGSLTKTFTATLICKAQLEGKLNIDDSIGKYLAVPADNYYPTIKAVLTHTSGYKPYYMAKGMSKNHLSGKNDFNGITKAQVLAQVEKANISPDKEYEFEYSNFGYAVLGLVLESVYKQTYTELVNNFLQNDLGMKNTYIANDSGNLGDYWDWQPDDAYLSAGALYSTIEDMIIYAKLNVAEDGVFAVTHKMFTTAKASSPMYVKMGIHMDEVGYAWILDSTNGFLWHNGATGNYNCYIGVNTKTEKACVVLSNISPDYRIPATVVGTKLMTR